MAQNSRAHRLNLFKKSPSVQQLREEVRKQFKEKLKLGRSNELCKRRDLFRSIISNVQRHFAEIEESLQQGNENLDTEEVLRVLKEVEDELYENESQRQVDQYALDLQEETEAILKHFSVCSACDRFTGFENNPANVICESCTKLYFNRTNL